MKRRDGFRFILTMLFLILQIVDLDTKRNRNREALNALRNEMSDSGETRPEDLAIQCNDL